MPTNLNQLLLGPFRKGARNDGVRALQERLNEVLAGTPGFVRLGTDGAFGAKTEAAVLRFQKARQLRADGIVGPITAKALGFAQYTSLQRLGTGAMQLASAITGSLARLVPSPHSEPDPAYDILIALATHAEVMRAMVAPLPAAASARLELEQIVASLKRQLEGMRTQPLLTGPLQAMADAVQVQLRLLALSQQLQTIARQQAGKPGLAPQSTLLEMLATQSQMLAAHAAALVGLQAMAMNRQVEAANEVLQIAARMANFAKKLVPRF